MHTFIKIPTVLEKTQDELMGIKGERIPSEVKVDPREISAYMQCIPDDNDSDAIIIYLKGGHQFYSSISIKQLERLMQEVI